MSEPNRTRRLNCRVTEDEYALIERKMQQLGTKNVSARRNSKLPKNCRQVMEYAGKLGS